MQKRNGQFMRAFAFILMCCSSWTLAASPSVGDQAPDFELSGSDGKQYRLSDFRDKQAVVIAFFPKAFTGG